MWIGKRANDDRDRKMRDKQSELKLRVCMNKEHMEAMAISIRHERMQRDDRSHREDGENATTTATIKNRVGTRERERE